MITASRPEFFVAGVNARATRCQINAQTYELESRFFLPALAAVVPFLCQSAAAEKSSPLTSKEIASRTIEDGGTGPFKAIIASDEALTTHTVFRPNDFSAAANKSKLPIVVWGNGACANSP